MSRVPQIAHNNNEIVSNRLTVKGLTLASRNLILVDCRIVTFHLCSATWILTGQIPYKAAGVSISIRVRKSRRHTACSQKLVLYRTPVTA